MIRYDSILKGKTSMIFEKKTNKYFILGFTDDIDRITKNI